MEKALWQIEQVKWFAKFRAGDFLLEDDVFYFMEKIKQTFWPTQYLLP